MKIKFKVATMFQRHIPRAAADEPPDLVTFIKLTPQDVPAGDLLLAFNDGEVVWHPEEWLKDRDGVPVKKMIHPETLVDSAQVTHGGESFTFEQGELVDIDVSLTKV